MILRLRWKEDDEWSTFEATPSSVIQLGRHQDSDIFLYDRNVSRQHGEITYDHRGPILRNVSTKGVPISVGNQVLSAEEEIELRDGHRILMGHSELFVYLEQADAVAQPKLQCSHCHNLVEYNPKGFCPFCGYALASGETMLVRK